ncbi:MULTISPECIES: hypothetical protein [unclassified Paenibacillus]|uniref:hypothetical protein n=1 Tax=unclassified Paenibacillus TaxID=185978 RepID=UPI001F3D332C|nr:hypothetical protein [Paenibacillus sp. JJ-223]CAH1218154.1 hypothetical protein PAECIP111890_04727 [Paenibacillus sp. JJ-223]
MREERLSREVRYGEQDIAELENASIQVHLIYKKAASLFQTDGRTHAASDRKTVDGKIQGPRPAVLQKWIRTSSGWKCIGCEVRIGQLPLQGAWFPNTMAKMPDGRTIRKELLIQAIVWSQYEEIRMLEPWLGQDTFYTPQEMDIIAKYVVPTYFSERPLHEQGKLYKVHRSPGSSIPLYQEYVKAPLLCVHVDGELLEGQLLTEVTVAEEQVFGLNPYVKNGDGGRTYMQANIQ